MKITKEKQAGKAPIGTHKVMGIPGLYLVVSLDGRNQTVNRNFYHRDYSKGGSMKLVGAYHEADFDMHDAIARIRDRRSFQNTGTGSLRSLIDEWYLTWAPQKSPGHAKRTLRGFELHAHDLLKERLSELTYPKIHASISKLVPAKRATASKLWDALNSALTHGVRHGRLNSNPLTGIKPPEFREANDRRYPFVPYDFKTKGRELKEMIQANIDGEVSASQTVRDAALLVMFIPMRSGVLTTLSVKNWDGKYLTQYREDLKIKTGRDYDVVVEPCPLLKKMLDRRAKLAKAPGGHGYLFPAINTTCATKHLGEEALCKYFKKLCMHVNGHSNITTHGFRSSFMTWSEEERIVDPHLASAVLDHAKDKVLSAYGRGDLSKVISNALLQWAKAIT